MTQTTRRSLCICGSSSASRRIELQATADDCNAKFYALSRGTKGKESWEKVSSVEGVDMSILNERDEQYVLRYVFSTKLCPSILATLLADHIFLKKWVPHNTQHDTVEILEGDAFVVRSVYRALLNVYQEYVVVEKVTTRPDGSIVGAIRSVEYELKPPVPRRLMKRPLRTMVRSLNPGSGYVIKGISNGGGSTVQFFFLYLGNKSSESSSSQMRLMANKLHRKLLGSIHQLTMRKLKKACDEIAAEGKVSSAQVDADEFMANQLSTMLLSDEFSACASHVGSKVDMFRLMAPTAENAAQASAHLGDDQLIPQTQVLSRSTPESSKEYNEARFLIRLFFYVQ
mmetsp:Transcript_18375/g.30615  ORF Transcript_18375/g.30615 Transcript_18375/m.30615 type:complete len:342 (+) Transcript_18375:90-1115(+)